MAANFQIKHSLRRVLPKECQLSGFQMDTTTQY